MPGPTGSDDPTVIASIAVHAEDVVTALEATRRSGAHTVLRVTPPFSGRMRARLHRPTGDGPPADAPRPVHVEADALVESIPPYPEPDETEDRLRAEGEYTTAAHREAHVAAVEAWREAVRAAIADAAVIETPRGRHRVEVKRLG